MKLDDTIEVEIGLYQDAMTPSIKALMLEQGEVGSYRLSNGKGCGSWDLVRKFKCSLTLRQLRMAKTS